MSMKNVLIFIGDVLAFVLAATIFMGFVTALGLVATILLLLLGRWIGIGPNILVYVAMFCIFCKAYDVLAWVVGKMSDRIERKNDSRF